MEILIPSRLSTLGHPQRLAVFRLLMRRYPDRVPATELAQALDLKPNTLSTYVNALMQVDLITRERIGTSLRYAINMEATRETIDFLMFDCCRGRPEICATQFDASPTESPPYNVLFLCTGNSARSIFAEAVLQKLGGDRFNAFSAGTKPRSQVNRLTQEVLAEEGYNPSQLSSQHINTFQGESAPVFDFVFTVCDQAANEDCPAWPGQPITAHWGVPDPVRVVGTPVEKMRAFRQTYDAVHSRIAAFTQLPFSSLDRMSLQHAVDTCPDRRSL